MEQKRKNQQKTDNKYKLLENEFQNVHSNVGNILSNENKKSKAIRYVVNMGKNKYIYKSPKIKHGNKILDSDFSYEDDSIILIIKMINHY